MKTPEIPDNETDRLRALDQTGLVDTAPEERFDRLTRIAKATFSVPIALVSLVTDDRQWFKSCQGLPVRETPRDISFCGHAIHGDDIMVVPDAPRDERFRDNPLVTGDPNIRFYAGASLRTLDGLRIGTLCIIDRQPRTLSDSQRGVLRDLADAVEAEINHTEVMALNQQLKSSEQRARWVIEGTQVGTWEWNVQTGETRFNERWAEIIGYQLSDLEPISIQTWLQAAHPDDLAESERLLNQHFSGETAFYDCICRMKHRNGHWVWVHDRGRVFSWTADGRPEWMFGTHEDITLQRQAEIELAESRDRYASLVENIPGITFRCLYDEQWTMLFMSNQTDPLSGYSAEELLMNQSVSYADLVLPEFREYLSQGIDEAVSEKRPWKLEYPIRHKDGSTRWVQERGAATLDDEGNVAYLEGFILDVTADHKNRSLLQRQNRAFECLNRIHLHAEGSLEDRIRSALEVSCEFLNMDVGILSEISGRWYEVRQAFARNGQAPEPGQGFDVAHTYCSLLLDTDSSYLAISDMGNSEFRGEKCYQMFGLEQYIAYRIVIEGQVFGTLNFSSAQARPRNFDEVDNLFVSLLARWVSLLIEQQLTESKVRQLAEQLPGMLYQFRRWPDGRESFPYASSGIKNVYGVDPADVADDASAAYQAICPDDIPRVAESIVESANTLTPWQIDYRVRGEPGQWRWVRGAASPNKLPDGSVVWHGFIGHIDQERKAMQAMEDSEYRLKSLFELSPIGIALNDFETGAFIDGNAALLAPTGYTKEEFRQLSYWDVTPETYADKEAEALEALKTRGAYGPFEKEYIRKDGTRYPILLQGVLTTDQNGRKLIWSLIEDISERKEIERLKDEFIATVSHELRTPLTSISGSLRLLSSGVAGDLCDQAQRLADTAYRGANRLIELVNDLLDIEKLMAGKMTFEWEWYELNALVTDALESLQGLATEKGVTLAWSGAADGAPVYVDEKRFHQALVNVVSNAIKFSPEGSPVEVSVSRSDQHLEVSVQDYGEGVPDTFKDRIFQRFAQADGSSRRQHGGTGLGLSITREIMIQMGGDVGFESVEGQGARFWLRLPLNSDNNA